MQMFRTVLVLTAASFIASAVFMHDATRYLANTNVALAPGLSALGRNLSRPVENNAPPYVELRIAQRSDKRSFLESLRVHSPFVATRSPNTGLFHPLQLPNETLRCARPDATPHSSVAVCNSFLHKQDHLHTREFKFHTRPAPTARTATLLDSNDLVCLDASLLVVELGPRDHNVRSWLQRLLLTWHVIARADASPGWLGPIARHRVVALLCPDAYCMGMLNGQPGKGSPFHVGGLQSLLLPPARGTDVVIARSLHAALEGLHAHVNRATTTRSSDTLCFRSAVHVLGFDTRFAFPDAELGANMGWFGNQSREAPEASDLVEARRAAFGPAGPPPMRAKLLYVRRGPWMERRWTAPSELLFSEMLRRVANKTGVELAFADTQLPQPLQFVVRIGEFAEAAAVIGMHGSALSLAAFAGAGARVVEIEPAYHRRVPLFSSLGGAGVRHEYFVLANGTDRADNKASELVAEDEKRLEQVLTRCVEDAMRENKLERVTRETAEEAGKPLVGAPGEAVNTTQT